MTFTTQYGAVKYANTPSLGTHDAAGPDVTINRAKNNIINAYFNRTRKYQGKTLRSHYGLSYMLQIA